MKDALQYLFARDIGQVSAEIAMYRYEPTIWTIDNGIANSAGNLCLHLAGNLRTYIGVELAGADFVRQRDQEFSQKDLPRAFLLQQMEETGALVTAGLGRLDESLLSAPFPNRIWGEEMSTGATLMRLATHLSYHLGQINYHRRLLDRQPEKISGIE